MYHNHTLVIRHAWPAYIGPVFFIIAGLAGSIGTWLIRHDVMRHLIDTWPSLDAHQESMETLAMGVAILPLMVVLIGGMKAWGRASWLCHIHSDRMVIQHGIIFKRFDNLELYRIRDIVGTSSIWGLWNIGDILLATTDYSDQMLPIRWMKGHRDLMDEIRFRVESSRMRAGIVGMS
jgi:hypothetical protein